MFPSFFIHDHAHIFQVFSFIFYTKSNVFQYLHLGDYFVSVQTACPALPRPAPPGLRNSPLFGYIICLVSKSCPALCNPMDWSPPGSSVRGISQAKNTGVGCRLLLQGSSRPRRWSRASCTGRQGFDAELPDAQPDAQDASSFSCWSAVRLSAVRPPPAVPQSISCVVLERWLYLAHI